MFSTDANAGLFTFMAGIVLVVFFGIGLSMVVDRRIGFSKSVISLENSIKNGRTEVEELQNAHSVLARRLEQIETSNRNAKSGLDPVSREIGGLHARVISLDSKRKNLQSDLETLETGFARYREKYRTTTWDAAINQPLGNLTTRGGRQYQEVFITRVTDMGLEIRHKNGSARIQAEDLEQSLQERFQWNVHAREAVPDNTLNPEPPSSPAQITGGDVNPPLKGNVDLKEPDDVEKLRENVMMWRSMIHRLEAERSFALSSAQGSQKAPTGSLETWQMRATRLERQIAGAQAKLARAKASLNVVAPNDPLLRSTPGRQ